jgi:glycosyltransferase involved in cell wall biosynthesis
MSETTPTVSVCVITFNHERFIAEAIESALVQKTSFDYEIVVGDDASTDDTSRILARLAERHAPRLRVLRRQVNLGINRNLAATLRECRGQYIALLEGDDYWTDDEKLQRQFEFLEAHADHAIVFHPVGVRGDSALRRLPAGRIPSRTKLEDLLTRGSFIPTASVMFRNRVAAGFPPCFFDLQIGDLPLNVMNARFGDIGMIDRIMAVYRIHSGGAFSSISNAQRVREVVRMYSCLNEFLEHKYERLIAGIQNYWLAVESFQRGDERTARACARIRFAASPWNRQRVLAGILVYAPALYRALHRLKGAPR